MMPYRSTAASTARCVRVCMHMCMLCVSIPPAVAATKLEAAESMLLQVNGVIIRVIIRVSITVIITVIVTGYSRVMKVGPARVIIIVVPVILEHELHLSV